MTSVLFNSLTGPSIGRQRCHARMNASARDEGDIRRHDVNGTTAISSTPAQSIDG